MRILVTGGAGFIGSNVVDEYINAGHKVWVIDNETSGSKKFINPKAQYQKMDVRNRQKLTNLFKKGRFDVVNHHAAQIDVRVSVQNPVFDAEVNIFGILNLLNLCREFKVKKFLFSASGGTVYGECTKPAPETSPERPLSPYGVSKLASEKYIQTYGSLFGLKYTIFRYGNVYGPRQDPHGEAGVVAIFSNNLLSGKQSFIFGNGRQTRDFVYVGDVARANRLALNRAHNKIVNIGTAKETSVNQLLTIMSEIVDSDLAPKYKKARPGELDRSVMSIRYAKRVLGWEPLFSIRNGLKQTIRFFESQRGRSKK